ncbi:outer membrane lipoprotein-sorting protein [Paraburkholderia sp. UCT70]|uniref:hypothetical protein n=1 Tax=Paraburkholderia sp. UCT70 TaxID=2991068 RepID=UPI003D1EFD62
MKRIALWALAASVGAFALAQTPAATADASLGTDEVVARNAEARGGADAWRKVTSMVWVGHVDSPNAPAPDLPFELALKRPDRTRFETTAANQMIVHVFDGKDGWKVRPSGGGGPDVRPYTSNEVKFARDEQVIDGPLLDHAAKGISVALEGTDKVEGRDAYRLLLRLPSGATRHVWVDAQNFLDVKYDREARGPSGRPATIEVMYRDFREVDGVRIPFVIESGAVGMDKKDRLVIDNVTLNPPLDSFTFANPVSQGRRASVKIGADASPASGAPVRPVR